ncbi:hypothetical protein J437_LFUL010945 [Ladona fulva]|uniref:Uncharacterized protein n=1 Tax=Ladona fulva TaxID=123851 RepID=A0A8K0P4I7_LADFU|nr:hypothetical protein J437_LFUL010945 [Ladona fulva]
MLEEFDEENGQVRCPRCRQCNIFRGSPGPTLATNAATTISEVFSMFFDDQIVDTICTFTNAEASRRANDKLAAIRDVWVWFEENCKRLFEAF